MNKTAAADTNDRKRGRFVDTDPLHWHITVSGRNSNWLSILCHEINVYNYSMPHCVVKVSYQKITIRGLCWWSNTWHACRGGFNQCCLCCCCCTVFNTCWWHFYMRKCKWSFRLIVSWWYIYTYRLRHGLEWQWCVVSLQESNSYTLILIGLLYTVYYKSHFMTYHVSNSLHCST